MVHDSEETEVVEEKPTAKPKLTIVVMLSVLLGILLTVLAAGGGLAYQKNKAAHVELSALKQELKDKSRVIDELHGQIEELSRQMASLKEYSIARSRTPQVKVEKPDAPATAGVAKPALIAPQGGGGAATDPATAFASPTPASVPNKIKQAKPKGVSCELVGKSPEEQAATLKRCVGAMDVPKGKTGAK